jgi:hypothetical protein
LPIPKDAQGKPAIHYTTVYKVFARWSDDGSLEQAFIARCPFRKSCASIFWARQRVKSWACSPHVVLTLLHDKDLDHARASCMPGIPGS